MSPDRPVGDLFRRFRERLSAERENGTAAGRESRSAAERENGSRATAAGPGVGRTDAGSRDAGLAPHPPR
ncbi:hypothetical protein G3I24_09040, partial [Micromonospora aurantiaca]|nr:hypothetical protein [Micromonospora aurantiaca]